MKKAPPPPHLQESAHWQQVVPIVNLRTHLFVYAAGYTQGYISRPYSNSKLPRKVSKITYMSIIHLKPTLTSSHPFL